MSGEQGRKQRGNQFEGWGVEEESAHAGKAGGRIGGGGGGGDGQLYGGLSGRDRWQREKAVLALKTERLVR